MTGAVSPAVAAARAAQERVEACLQDGLNFRLEAGAGAGKTYFLVEALKKIIAERGPALIRAGQKVACITYTEVASPRPGRRNPSAVLAPPVGTIWRDATAGYASLSLGVRSEP